MYLLRNRPTSGGRALANNLGIKTQRTLKNQEEVFINWGCSTIEGYDEASYLAFNRPSAVKNAINKINTLQILQKNEIKVPEFITESLENYENDSDDIYLARTKIKSSGGEGIVIVRPGEVFPRAALYTKYIKKALEYRMHVFQDSVFLVSQKKKRNNAEQTKDQKLIRNHDNGWIFATQEITAPPSAALEIAKNAIDKMNLSFGAVDLIIDRDTEEPVILEINTAPGLENSTLDAYTLAFSRLW